MPIQVTVQDYVELTLDLSGTLDPRVVIQRILEKSVAVADADRVTLSTLHPDGTLTIEAGVGWGDDVQWDRRVYDSDRVRKQQSVVEMLSTRATVLSGAFDPAEALPEDRPALALAQSTAVVPILQEGEVVGMLVLSRYHDRTFKPQDIPTLTAFGALAGLALRNARTYDDAANTARRMEAATYAAAEVAQAHELPELLDALIRRSCEAADADTGAVMRREGDGAVVEATSGVAPVGTRFPLDDAVQAAIDAGEVIQVATVSQPGSPLGQYTDNYGHALITPMRFSGELLGLLVLGRTRDRPAFSADDIDGLRPFATLAAMVLHSGRLVQQLRDAELAKREFINIAVHELRGPLTIVEGYTEMLLADIPEADVDVRSQLAIIRRQAEHAQRLAEDLLILSRLESDELGVRADAVPLVEVIDNVVDRLRPRVEMRNGDITVSNLDALAIQGDRKLFERIVDNLVGNAIDYSAEAPVVNVAAQRADGEVLIRVRDHGVGVPPEEEESIFARFSRGSRVGRVKGSGLGLYLSREGARKMGGDIVLEADPRRPGSTFVLRLPAATG